MMLLLAIPRSRPSVEVFAAAIQEAVALSTDPPELVDLNGPSPVRARKARRTTKRKKG